MNQRLCAILAASSLCAALAIGACGGSLPGNTQSTATSAAGPGATTTGSSGGEMGGIGSRGGAPDCIKNPKTHVEIINACTTADRVEKMPTLPLLRPGGELPPLP